MKEQKIRLAECKVMKEQKVRLAKVRVQSYKGKEGPPSKD